MPEGVSLTDKEWQDLMRLREESGRAYERRYTLLYWSIIIVIGLLSFVATEKFPLSVSFLPLIMIVLLMWLDFRINEQILSLETYRKVFYETEYNYFRETAKVKYFELEEGRMNSAQKFFHYVFDHAEFQTCYSIILLVCLVIIWIRVPTEYFILLVISSCAALSLISFTHIQYLRLNSRRRKKLEIWQKVKEEIKLKQKNTE